MKKILLIVFALAAIITGLLLVAPEVIDWNAYRRDVAAAVAAATGRKVTIAGDLHVAILPLPRLTVSQVGIGNTADASDPDVLRIGELRMQLAVDSLLKGRIAVRSLALVDPELYLETTADGRHSWDILPFGHRRGSAGTVMGVPVESVSISNGRVVWRRQHTAPREFDAITATARIADLAGTLHVQGRASFASVPLRFRVNLGRIGRDEGAPVSAKIDIADGAGTLDATGRLGGPDAPAVGKIRFAAPNAAELMAALGPDSRAVVPPWPVAAQSGFTAHRDEIVLHGLGLTYGEIRAAGKATIALDAQPLVAATLRMGTMDFDSLLSAAKRGGRHRSVPAGAEPTAGKPILPAGVTANLDLSVMAARWRGGVVRDVGLAVHLGPDAMEIGRLAAKLPGGTDVTLAGVAKPVGQDLRFEGDLAVISDNLRRALIWAGAAEERLPPDRLRSFSYTSRIAVAPDAVHLAGIAAQLDATRITGAATIARQARPAFGLRLKLDRLDLDSYLPQWLRAEGDTAAGGIVGADQLDANVNLLVDRLAVSDKALSQVSVDAQLFDNNVVLRNLSVGDFGGSALSAAGAIDDLSDTPRGDLDVTLRGGDAERFAGFMDIHPTAIATRLGRFNARAHVSGTVESAAVSGSLEIAGGTMRAEGTVRGSADNGPAYALAIAVSHPDGEKALGLLVPDRPRGGVGAMRASFTVTGDAGALHVRDLDASLSDAEIAGRIDADFAGDRPKVSTVLSAGELDLDRLWPSGSTLYYDAAAPPPRGSARWSREAIDLSALQALDMDLTVRSDAVARGALRIDNFKLHAGLTAGTLDIDRLTGNLFGGDVEATGRIEATADPRFAGTISARGAAARPTLAAIAGFDRLEGPISISVTLSARGRNPFDLVSSLSGSASVSGTMHAQRHGIEPIPAGPAGDAIVLILNAFAGRSATLNGHVRIGSGTMRSGDLALDGNDVAALTAGAVDLAEWRINTTTTLRREGNAVGSPELVVRVNGSLNDPDVRLSGAAVEAGGREAPTPDAAPVVPVEPSALPPEKAGQSP